MKAKLESISDLKLYTEKFLPRIGDIVSRNFGLYTCCACNRSLSTLCVTCRSKVIYSTPACPICEKFSVAGVVHSLCKISKPFFTHSFSCFAYTKIVKCLLLSYKYKQNFQLQREIEVLISAYFALNPFNVIVSWNKILEGKRILVVPVPMSRNKQEERGFSPAYEFAIIFGRIIKKLFGAEVSIASTLLTKSGDSGAQAKRNKRQRLLSLQKLYAVNTQAIKLFHEFKPDALCIVDDVLTTGATTTVVIEKLVGVTDIRQKLEKIPILRLTFASA